MSNLCKAVPLYFVACKVLFGCLKLVCALHWIVLACLCHSYMLTNSLAFFLSALASLSTAAV